MWKTEGKKHVAEINIIGDWWKQTWWMLQYSKRYLLFQIKYTQLCIKTSQFINGHLWLYYILYLIFGIKHYIYILLTDVGNGRCKKSRWRRLYIMYCCIILYKTASVPKHVEITTCNFQIKVKQWTELGA